MIGIPNKLLRCIVDKRSNCSSPIAVCPGFSSCKLPASVGSYDSWSRTSSASSSMAPDPKRIGSLLSFSGFSSMAGKGASKRPTGPELFVFVHGEEVKDFITSGLQACEQRRIDRVWNWPPAVTKTCISASSLPIQIPPCHTLVPFFFKGCLNPNTNSPKGRILPWYLWPNTVSKAVALIAECSWNLLRRNTECTSAHARRQ